MSGHDQLYDKLIPSSPSDIGVCYYCGCESDSFDYAPPVRYAEFYISTRLGGSFLEIPCCKECFDFLSIFKSSYIDERSDFVKRKIANKYKKSLSIYEKWNEDELVDIEYKLASSIRAGIALGAESYKRVTYPGFDYEVDGVKVNYVRKDSKQFLVDDISFSEFRDALQYASSAYGINVNTLKDWLIDNQGDFNVAISAFHENQRRILEEKELRKRCKEFAEKHKQNVNFVYGALEAYSEANPDLSVEECLELIYVERVKKVGH